jgi:Sensors of blue-light using FAD
MYHLVYTSHATQPLDEKALISLLKKSRASNAKKNITGMLLFVNGKFMQVLEGDKKSVTSIYQIIQNDPRHSRVTLLIEGESEKRIFTNWSMGFKNLSEEEFVTLSGFQDPHNFFMNQNLTEESSLVLVFLRLFYKKNMVDYPEPAIS